jgi:hypothetical protein
MDARRARLALLADDESASSVDEDSSRNAAEGAEGSGEDFAPIV